MEVLDRERAVWERQERERRGMFAEDEVTKNILRAAFINMKLIGLNARLPGRLDRAPSFAGAFVDACDSAPIYLNQGSRRTSAVVDPTNHLPIPYLIVENLAERSSAEMTRMAGNEDCGAVAIRSIVSRD